MRVAVIGESPAKGFENCTPIWGVRETDGMRCATGRRWGLWALAVGLLPNECEYYNVSTGVPDLTECVLVITLGCKARAYATKHGIAHFPLPHPSGRNRQLNDKHALYLILDTLAKEVRRLKYGAEVI